MGKKVPWKPRGVVAGENDLATLRPDLEKQWSAKNAYAASQIAFSSAYRAIWECERNHEWTTAVNVRTTQRGHYSLVGCPYCSGRKAWVGENDLATLDPALAAQMSERNLPLTARQITLGSNRKLWWRGECGHEWQATTLERRGTGRGKHKGTGCPYCAGKRVIPGETDLASQYPEIAVELDSAEIEAVNITVGSNRRLWWKCERGHRWQATVVDRVSGHGCKNCVAAAQSSAGENELATFIEGLLPEGAVQRHVRGLLPGWHEFDIYVPSVQVAVEFNGVYWHSDKPDKPANRRHERKWQAASQAGIELVQVWEDDWREKQELVKRILRLKLGLTMPKVPLEKTEAVTVPQAEADAFLEQHDLQGPADCDFFFGLVSAEDNRRLLALVGLSKAEGETDRYLEIVRYAAVDDSGAGLKLLLQHASRELAPEAYVAFSDRMVSRDELYRAQGFVEAGSRPVDYRYVNNNLRIGKDLSGVHRPRGGATPLRKAWDAGQSRWVLSAS